MVGNGPDVAGGDGEGRRGRWLGFGDEGLELADGFDDVGFYRAVPYAAGAAPLDPQVTTIVERDVLGE